CIRSICSKGRSVGNGEWRPLLRQSALAEQQHGRVAKRDVWDGQSAAREGIYHRPEFRRNSEARCFSATPPAKAAPVGGLGAIPQSNTNKPSLQRSNAQALPAPELGQLRAHSNLIQQVEAQFLSGADPAAKNKFNELMGGLISGKLKVNDIRVEAKS